MNDSIPFVRRLRRGAASVLMLALVAGLVALVLAASGSARSESRATTTASPMASAKARALHDHMRRLWEDHGAWTHMVIVSFIGSLPNLSAEEHVLLHNQVEIGNAVKPYYGKAAGHQLTKLLKEHIVGAVTVLKAAKSGSASRLKSAERAWFANGRQIADFLHSANPRFIPRKAAREMMRTHLDQVIQQATDELEGHYRASARDYKPYITHILMMADTISGGIIKQFPGRF
jgi:hypothetical protein